MHRAVRFFYGGYDNPEVFPDARRFERLSAERGAREYLHLLELDLEVPRRSRVFYEIHHGRLEDHVGYPHPSRVIRGYDPVGARPEYLLLRAFVPRPRVDEQVGVEPARAEYDVQVLGVRSEDGNETVRPLYPGLNQHVVPRGVTLDDNQVFLIGRIDRLLLYRDDIFAL